MAKAICKIYLTRYVKHCEEGFFCGVDPSELTTNSSDMKVNKEVKPYKEIHYNLICSDSKPINMPADSIHSKSCSLNVITEGVQSSPPGRIKYELSVENDKNSHILAINHFSFVRLHPNQKRQYTLNLNMPSADTETLAFVLDGKYGSFKACLRIDRTDGDCHQTVDVDASNQGLHEAYKRLAVDYSDRSKSIGKVFNVELTGSESGAGLIFGAAEMTGSQLTSLSAREIKAGLPIADRLPKHNHTTYYTFEVSKPEGMDGVNLITISLNAIKGSLMMAVRNDDIKPTEENYQWKSMGGELTISREDPWFKDNGRYVIAVIPVFEGDPNQEYSYHLKWLYTDKHSILIPGLVEYGTMNSQRNCYVAEIVPSYNSVLLFKGGNTEIEAYISIGREHHLPEGSDYDLSISSGRSGIEITQSDIEKHCKDTFSKSHHCNAYICLYGKKGDSIMLAMSANHQPLTLSHSLVFNGPVPVGDQDLKFIYHPPKFKSIDIEEFSAQQESHIMASVQESSDSLKWPTEGTDTGVSSLIHVAEEKINQFKNPLILIVIKKSSNTPQTTESFNFDIKFSLEAGAELKELTANTARTIVATQAMWSYFYFYSYRPTENIVIGLDSLDGGDADIFVGRGKDTRPSLSAFLARSVGYRSAYVELNAQSIKAKGYEDMKGYYVVGVKANSDVRYSLKWKYESSSIIQATFNEQRSATIKANDEMHVFIYNLFNEDIEFVLDTHNQKAEVYWNSFQKSTQNIAEEFPTDTINKMKWDIQGIGQARLLPISKDAAGACSMCKYLYTVKNLNPTQPIVVDFSFNLKGEAGLKLEPMEITPGLAVSGVLSAGESKRYSLNIPVVDKNLMSKYYIECQILHGKGQFKGLKVAQTVESLFSQDVHTGFNHISLEQMAKYDQYHTFISMNGINMASSVVELECTDLCNYKLTLVKPEIFTQLVVNQPREYFVQDETHSETFLYKASGYEPRFDVNMVVTEYTDEGLHSLDNRMLRTAIDIWHVKDKSDASTNGTRTRLVPLNEDIDGLNGKIHISYPILAGYYLIEVKGIKRTGFTYRLEISNDFVSTLLPGRQSVGIIPEQNTNMTFEFYPHQPGSVIAKVERCYGDLTLSVSQLDSKDEPQAVFFDNQRFSSIYDAKDAGKPVFLHAHKTSNKQTNVNERGYIDKSKNISIFSIEVVERSALDSLPVSMIKPLDEELSIDLKSNPPTVHFRPIVVPESVTQYQTRYYVAISKDPEALDFYSGCDLAMMSKVLKKGFTVQDAIQVYAADLDIKSNLEISTLKPFYSLPLTNLASGHRYFAMMFAQVTVKTAANKPSVGASNSIRVRYARLDFEYRSYFYPIELLAATVGMIGLLVATLCAFNTKLMTLVKKSMKFKQLEASDVDEDLEDYFMRIKYDYEREEASRVEASMNDSSVDDAGVDRSDLKVTDPQELVDNEDAEV